MLRCLLEMHILTTEKLRWRRHRSFMPQTPDRMMRRALLGRRALLQRRPGSWRRRCNLPPCSWQQHALMGQTPVRAFLVFRLAAGSAALQRAQAVAVVAHAALAVSCQKRQQQQRQVGVHGHSRPSIVDPCQRHACSDMPAAAVLTAAARCRGSACGMVLLGLAVAAGSKCVRAAADEVIALSHCNACATMPV